LFSTTMPTPTAISQHLRAAREILQGVTVGAECVWNSEINITLEADIRVHRIATTQDKAEVRQTNRVDKRIATNVVVFSSTPSSKTYSRSSV